MPTLSNYFLITCLFLSFQCFSQVSFNYAYQFGSIESDNPGTALVDSKGNIYTMAEYEDTVDIDPTEYTDFRHPLGEYFLILSKYDKNGQVAWNHEFNDNGSFYANLIGVINDKIY